MKFLCPPKAPEDFVDVAASPGATGREDCQAQWQLAIAHYLNNVTLLDVGAGLGESKARMSVRGITVTTQDIFPKASVDTSEELHLIKPKSFDAVTAFDVIEHVQDPQRFLADMARVATKWVAISTPNYLVSHNTHRFHVREFAPYELPLVGDQLGLRFHTAWRQMPGRGVFPSDRKALEACVATHGYCILWAVD